MSFSGMVQIRVTVPAVRVPCRAAARRRAESSRPPRPDSGRAESSRPPRPDSGRADKRRPYDCYPQGSVLEPDSAKRAGVSVKFLTYDVVMKLVVVSLILQATDLYRQRFFLDPRHEWGLHVRAGFLRWFAKWPYAPPTTAPIGRS